MDKQQKQQPQRTLKTRDYLSARQTAASCATRLMEAIILSKKIQPPKDEKELQEVIKKLPAAIEALAEDIYGWLIEGEERNGETR